MLSDTPTGAMTVQRQTIKGQRAPRLLSPEAADCILPIDASLSINLFSLHHCWLLNSFLLLLLLSRFSPVRLCDPIDGSPPGSAIPGILQARTLEWVAISFFNAWKWKGRLLLEFFPTRSRQILLGGSFQELAKMWDMTILWHRVFLQPIY